MDPWHTGDTIAAISTPLGAGGIGIVRLSGPDAGAIARRLFRPRHPRRAWRSHRLTLGHIIDAQGAVLDEVLLAFMQAPHTYTREDVVEIQCHSGIAVLRRILGEVLAAGARLAGPGEFTLRAFLSGRLDLTQAEAVAELIAARTEAGLRVAAEHLGGGFGRRVQKCRAALVELLAILEAMIDFGEEASDIHSLDVTRELLARKSQVEAWVDSYREGRLLREGLLVVIAGRPNVGKSSLLNRLLAAERAIVTDIPGTTRDLIEETLDLGGVPVRLTDTAGLREARDPVEEIGVARTRERLAHADLVLYLLDGSQPWVEDDRAALAELAHRPALAVINKIDLPPMLRDEDIRTVAPLPVLRLSALTGQGVDELKGAVLHQVLAGGLSGERQLVTQERQAQHLRRCLACLERACELLAGGRRQDAPWELAAYELQEAVRELGAITGEDVGEEVLDRIFSRFCIGK